MNFEIKHDRPMTPLYSYNGNVVELVPDTDNELFSIGNGVDMIIVRPKNRTIELIGEIDNLIIDLCITCAKSLCDTDVPGFNFGECFTLIENKLVINFNYSPPEQLVKFINKFNDNFERILKTTLLLR